MIKKDIVDKLKVEELNLINTVYSLEEQEEALGKIEEHIKTHLDMTLHTAKSCANNLKLVIAYLEEEEENK